MVIALDDLHALSGHRDLPVPFAGLREELLECPELMMLCLQDLPYKILDEWQVIRSDVEQLLLIALGDRFEEVCQRTMLQLIR
mgnify:CR=1 FL=1